MEKEIYFLLKEKLRVLCWRSLIRRVWLLGAGQPRVDLNLLVNVVQLLTKDTSFDIWDVECITGSLLDQVSFYSSYYICQKKGGLCLFIWRNKKMNKATDNYFFFFSFFMLGTNRATSEDISTQKRRFWSSQRQTPSHLFIAWK